MTHKTNPKVYRLKEMRDWHSRGFYEKDFAKYLEQDFKIRKFLEGKIGRFWIEKIEIERFPAKLNVVIYTSRPGLIIGRRGGDIEKLKNELEEKIVKEKGRVHLEVVEVSNMWTSAPLMAKWMAYQVEKRTPYRRVLKAALSKIMSQKGVKGARVQLKGRLDGIEIARTEWMQEGRLPRHTLRCPIDYGEAQAYCTYGVVGAKVWIFKEQET